MSHFRLSAKSWMTVLAFVFAFLLAGEWGLAQLNLATFQGKLTDDQGEPIEGAVFHMKDLGRGTEITFKSNKKGSFYRRGLQASEYELTIEKEGYVPFQDRLTLKAGEEMRVDLQLGLAMTPAQEAFQRGFAAFGNGDLAGAQAGFEEAVQLDPDMTEAHTNLGLVYLQLSRVDEGIAELEKAVAQDPESIRLRFQLAAAYAQGNQLEKAIGAFEKGLKSSSAGLSDPLIFESTNGLAGLYFAAGRVDEAIKTYETTLAARPESPVPLLGLGKCYFNQGDQAQALRYFERVVETAPDSPQAADAKMFIAEIKKEEPQS